MDPVRQRILEKVRSGPVRRDEIHHLPDGPEVARQLMKEGLICFNEFLEYQAVPPKLRVVRWEE